MQSKEIEQLASEFEKCQRILIALGDENRLHMIPEKMNKTAQRCEKTGIDDHDFVLVIDSCFVIL